MAKVDDAGILDFLQGAVKLLGVDGRNSRHRQQYCGSSHESEFLEHNDPPMGACVIDGPCGTAGLAACRRNPPGKPGLRKHGRAGGRHCTAQGQGTATRILVFFRGFGRTLLGGGRICTHSEGELHTVRDSQLM